MAKLTLLDIVRDVLSDMSSDNVSSVGDTAESDRVAAIAKSQYFKMMQEKNWPHLGNISQLDALGDPTRPSHMRLPENIRYVEWIKYNRKVNVIDPERFTDIEYVEPTEFMDRVNSRDSTATNIDVVTDFSGISLNIRNDLSPSFYTSFDDIHIVFDSYNSNLEASLQASKTQCFSYREPLWGSTFTVHAVSTLHALDDIIAVTPVATTYYYRCSVGGTTDAVDQSANYPEIVGASYTDGTATFVMVGTSSDDAFIPDLPAHIFPLYLSQVKSACQNKIKQSVDSLEERDAKRQRVIMQKADHKHRKRVTWRNQGFGRS